MRALLAVNVLIALLDAGHLHHRLATDWLIAHIDRGWASCPSTQNGRIRIFLHSAYPNAVPAFQIAGRLAQATEQDAHAFWPDSIRLLEPRRLAWDRLPGSRQVTDAYLLALAVEHGGVWSRRIGAFPWQRCAVRSPGIWWFCLEREWAEFLTGRPLDNVPRISSERSQTEETLSGGHHGQATVASRQYGVNVGSKLRLCPSWNASQRCCAMPPDGQSRA